MWENTCRGCGDTFVEAGTVDDKEEFGRRCMVCALNGRVEYYVRVRL